MAADDSDIPVPHLTIRSVQHPGDGIQFYPSVGGLSLITEDGDTGSVFVMCMSRPDATRLASFIAEHIGAAA